MNKNKFIEAIINNWPQVVTLSIAIVVYTVTDHNHLLAMEQKMITEDKRQDKQDLQIDELRQIVVTDSAILKMMLREKDNNIVK